MLAQQTPPHLSTCCARLVHASESRASALQALHSVATAFLEAEDLPPALLPGIVDHMVGVHQSVRSFSARFADQLKRYNYVTVSTSRVHQPVGCRTIGCLSLHPLRPCELPWLPAHVLLCAAVPQPKSYLDYIATYKSSLAARRQENTDQTKRLEGGLAKLIQAAAEVCSRATPMPTLYSH